MIGRLPGKLHCPRQCHGDLQLHLLTGDFFHCERRLRSLPLLQDGVNLLSSSEGGELSASGEHFLAGVLHHLPALLCFTAPSTNSYRWGRAGAVRHGAPGMPAQMRAGGSARSTTHQQRVLLPSARRRLQPSCWTGAFQVWGMQNREAALRVCGTPGQPESRNCEFKVRVQGWFFLLLGGVGWGWVCGLECGGRGLTDACTQADTWSEAVHVLAASKAAPLCAAGQGRAEVPGGMCLTWMRQGFDATANPYLGLAAIVVAGMDGLERKLKLPPALDVDPGALLCGRQGAHASDGCCTGKAGQAPPGLQALNQFSAVCRHPVHGRAGAGGNQAAAHQPGASAGGAAARHRCGRMCGRQAGLASPCLLRCGPHFGRQQHSASPRSASHPLAAADLRSALEEVMGETLVRAFLVVRAVELKAFGRKSIKEEALALYTRY